VGERDVIGEAMTGELDTFSRPVELLAAAAETPDEVTSDSSWRFMEQSAGRWPGAPSRRHSTPSFRISEITAEGAFGPGTRRLQA
jgi:hypothetical protein